jgi:DNA-binding PadR family transcriptional regulator
MREPTYYVLACLLDGPLHGYAIIKRAGELSQGRVRLATGTLYTALDRLTAEGQVRLVSDEVVSGRVRRSYGLTESGASALRAEATRMAEAARIVTRDSPPARTTRSPRPARTAQNVRTA